jgi:hypothetical protein
MSRQKSFLIAEIEHKKHVRAKRIADIVAHMLG